MERTMEPLPEVGGIVGAAMGCSQMVTGAVVSGLVGVLHDGHTAPAMTGLMALCVLLASASYLLLARPSECVVPR
jgi:DHA1 family bicyclomycin/chloramphenicol resistance-like MFS transporter